MLPISSEIVSSSVSRFSISNSSCDSKDLTFSTSNSSFASKVEFLTMLRIENTNGNKMSKPMIPPKMRVDFFHFLEEVGPLWDEMDASSAAMIGSWEVFMVLVRMCQVGSTGKWHPIFWHLR